ncbi:beta carbonic anhydrase 5, chloroplastic isoform X3 [Cucumis sativus]|uniref:beta carbonic anhydrase 5, chloroplastic isoform X3 n=1 Tax=Cucumis sativus TaxID=3659 RepID=UPI0012F4B550|nr:beta carbonic anhydrase 5, chloroplastic isoform X3 [Cucumis sativus]
MGRPIRPRAFWGLLISEMAAIRPTLFHKNPFLFSSFSVGRSSLSAKEEIDEAHLGVSSNLIHELEVKNVVQVKDERKLFDEMQRRFLSFKKHNYLEHLEHFQALAELQTPKNGPTETNAALEFAVNTLEVENILVIGHSSCAGIQSLMSMQDNATGSSLFCHGSFVHKWVVNAKAAKLRAKAAAAHLSFDQQCKHCEKESINLSLKNLMSYPWIEERLKQDLISVHGGYYDFLNCTFEKWSLDYKNTSRVDNDDDDRVCHIKDQTIWC